MIFDTRCCSHAEIPNSRCFLFQAMISTVLSGYCSGLSRDMAAATAASMVVKISSAAPALSHRNHSHRPAPHRVADRPNSGSILFAETRSSSPDSPSCGRPLALLRSANRAMVRESASETHGKVFFISDSAAGSARRGVAN